MHNLKDTVSRCAKIYTNLYSLDLICLLILLITAFFVYSVNHYLKMLLSKMIKVVFLLLYFFVLHISFKVCQIDSNRLAQIRLQK